MPRLEWRGIRVSGLDGCREFASGKAKAIRGGWPFSAWSLPEGYLKDAMALASSS
jgi:hypothetical protein